MLIEADMALIDIVVPVAIVLVIYAIRYFLKKPLVYDLYGKKSKKITKHDEEIKYIIDYISDAEKSGVKEIKIIADADEATQIIDHAKNKEFKIKAIIGPGDELLNLNLNQNDLIEVRILENRPEKHFAIIGPHLFIESPHSALKKERSVLCITNPSYKYFRYFSKVFDALWSKLDKKLPPIASSNVVPPDEDSTTGDYSFTFQV